MRAVQIILSAGGSRRMGTAKALLDFDGKSALRLVLEAGAGAGVELSVVVLGRHAASIRAAHPRAELPGPTAWVVNDDPESKPLDSLKLAVETLRSKPFDVFFFQPVDCPLPRVDDYRALLEEARGAADSATVFFLSDGHRRGHPVLCRRSLIPKLAGLGEGATARDAFAGEAARHVLSAHPGPFEDMDTREDYERLLALLRATPP